LSQGGTTVPGSVTFSGNNIIQGGDISGSRAVMIGQGEVKLVGTGAQHYSIINKEGKFSIENTSKNGSLDPSASEGKKLIEIIGDYNTKSANTIKVNDTAFGLSEIKDTSGTLINHFPIIDLGANDSTREGNAGKIGYGHPIWDSTALGIVGKGTSNTTRKIRMWDNLQVENNINCKSITIGKWTLSDISDNLIVKSGVTNKEFLFHKDGHFRVKDGMISTDYDIEFGSYNYANRKPWRLVGQTNAVYIMEKNSKSDNTTFLSYGPENFGGTMTHYILNAGASPRTL
jgi:hypothetical protein